jgi:very-short-patch-repair endonuclease
MWCSLIYAISHLPPLSIRPKIKQIINHLHGVEMSSQKPGCLAALFGFGRKQNETEKFYEDEAEERFPYKAKPYFFSNAEASFYHFLRQMAGADVIIFPHVSLRDLVSVTESQEYYKYNNKIDRKQVDFLLVESKTLRPRLVIELDDKTHNRADRIQRDEFVEKVLEVANIPIVRIPVQPTYDAKEIAKIFKSAIETNQLIIK